MKKIFIGAAVILLSVFAVIMIVGATGSSNETKKANTELTGACAKTATTAAGCAAESKVACCDKTAMAACCDKTATAQAHCDPSACAKPDCCKSDAAGDLTKTAAACTETAEAKPCNPAACASHK